MRRIVVLGLFAFLSVALPARGLELVSAERSSGDLPRIDVRSSNQLGVRLDFRLPELVAEDVAREGLPFRSLSISGGGHSGVIGEPDLPTFTRLLAVPDGKLARVRVRSIETSDHPGIRPLPMQSDDEGAFAYSAAAYAFDRTRNAPPAVEVGEPAILRDLRVVPVTFRPVSWDAAGEGIRVAHRIDVDIEFVDSAARTERPTPQPAVPESFDRLYRALVLNYEAPAREQISTPGTYLVICPDDLAVTSALQPLLDWRERSGTPTILATTAETGTSTSQILSYIQGVYDDPAVSLEYVVLVGDASGTYAIPTWYESLSGYNGEGDLPYSQLDGADALPDVHLGRLSIDSVTTLQNIVSKIVGYEMTPELSDSSWFTRSCITGDPSHSGYSCIQSGRWLALRLAEVGYTEADTIFAGSWVTEMQTALNRGDTVFGYRGWLGMSNWSNGYTGLLANQWKMPFAVIITCDTGSFASGTSRSEGFLRAWNSTAGVPRGAIGAVGMATIGTHTRYNNCLYYGIFRGLLQEQQYTMGSALTRGALEMFLNYGKTEPTVVQYWNHWANLMGDPAVDIWTSVPEALSVAHPAAVVLGENAVAVTVTDAGTPVEGARVCLSKGAETYVVGTTDASGFLELPVSPATAGDLLLTVTKHDKQPYLATVPVAAAASWVGYDGSTLDDDAVGESLGNGDGIANPGETVELGVQLRNFGAQIETSVAATLTSADPYLTIVDGQETYGTIGVGGSVGSPDDFDFTIADGCPDGHVLALGLEVSGDTGSWHSRIQLPVSSARLVVLGATADGSGNGRLDPGETVELSVLLRNDGSTSATSVTGTLIAQSSLVSVGDGSAGFGTIGIGGTGQNSADPFTVSADAGTYEGYLASFLLVTTFSGGAIDTAEVLLTVGSRTSDDPVGPDAYGYLAYDDTDVAYPDAPVYDWVEIDPAYGGEGVEIVLTDFGEYQDDVRVVTLPFAFDYYGETWTTASICSNGWLAMGSTPLDVYRNWTIPGAGGPNAMLAVFWDNLYQTGGSKTFQKHDALNHRWIVEWSRFRNIYNGATETFQAILYDPAYHATDTGDGIIVYQYQTVSNPDVVNGNATVGIESPDQSDGVLYTYFNRYSEGAASLAAGRAIRFVPTQPGPTGTLSGSALNASNGNTPIEGVEIEVLGVGRVFASGVDGAYGGAVTPGTYSVVARHAGFAPDTANGVSILEAATTTQDFQLVDIAGPIVTTTPHPWTEDETGPYPIPVKIEEDSGLVQKALFYSTGGGSYSALTLQALGGDDYLAEIPGQPIGTVVRYYVNAQDGLGFKTTDPPTAPSLPFLFGVARTDTLVAETFEAPSGWTVGASGDGASTGVWLRADPVGTEYGGYPIQPEDDHTVAPGTNCFVTGNANPGESAGTNDVDGGKTTLLSPVYDLSQAMTATVSYWVWYSNDRGTSSGDDTWNVAVTDDGTTWTSLESTGLSTSESWAHRSFDLDQHIDLTDQVQFRFVASDEGVASLVEAAVDDFLILGMSDTFTGVEPGLGDVVLANRFETGQPNPFRGRTRFSFALVNAGPASLRIYDVAGRLVRTLVNEPVDAGRHQVEWDGRSRAGARAASGVYFARFSTTDFTRVNRITLLR